VTVWLGTYPARAAVTVPGRLVTGLPEETVRLGPATVTEELSPLSTPVQLPWRGCTE
jgi:hypothetical protein